MAIVKSQVVTLECDGPCGKKFQSHGVPEDWEVLKFMKASYPRNTSPIKSQATLCPTCSVVARTLLQESGFKLQFANEQKNGVER